MQVYVCNNIDRVHGRIPQPGIALVRGQYYIYRMRTCVLKPELGGQLASPAAPVLPLYEVSITFIVCVRAY